MTGPQVTPTAVPAAILGSRLEGTPRTARRFDVAIVGAGPVGTALALLLAQRAPQLRIALVDGRGPQAGYDDPRTLALSHGSREILARAGAWPHQGAGLDCTPIRHIHVSQARRFGSTEIDYLDHQVPALGYVVRYGALMRALDAAMSRLPSRIAHAPPGEIGRTDESRESVEADDSPGLHHFRPYRAIALRQDAGEVTLTLGTSIDDHAQTLHATLAVNAEGGLFEGQTARARSRDYGQTAIIAQVKASSPVAHRAFERFTEEGPLALLPQEDGYAMVWCIRPETASRLQALSDAEFLSELGNAFGSRLGRFVAATPRVAYPLGLNAHNIATARTAAIGNAAQTLHPVAGQGLNLGLRDVAVLAKLLSEDLSSASLERFTTQRQTDRSLTIRITDTMARIFASAPDGAPTQAMLGLSLGLIDAVKPAKRLLAEHMMFGAR